VKGDHKIEGDPKGEGGEVELSSDRPQRRPALLVLEDGEVFEGETAGYVPPDGVTTGELVFNTSMSGYQEVLTDPSYSGQVVCFTYPHIGSYGVTPADDEADQIWTRGFVVRDLPPRPSNWRASATFESMLASRGVPGISGIDTRRVTRQVRSKGAVACAFGTAALSVLEQAAAEEPGTTGADLVTGSDGVSTGETYVVGSGELRVVAYDFGVKHTTLRCLSEFATVTVVPAGTPASDAMALDPHGIFLSNGPGDPSALGGATSTVSDLLGRLPIFGICLGHQLLATALGATTYKLPFGHHGGNHPVRSFDTGRVEITAQNHNYAVSSASLEGVAEVTHVNLNDGVVEGIRASSVPAFGVQYHPEAGPGPHDARYLFETFRRLMSDRSVKMVAG
jgi:carbamoyl-phosphate synthase small subunit